MNRARLTTALTQKQLTTFACCAAFVVLGVCSTLLGPSYQSLTQRFGIPLENDGIFTSLQFSGSLISVIMVGRLLDRINARYALIGGVCLMSASLFAISRAPTLSVAFAATLFLGLGMGALNITPNVVIALLYKDGAATALNILNLFWAIGAITGPQVVNFALSQHDFTLAYRITSIAALALIIPFLTISVSLLPVTGPRVGNGPPRHWTTILPFALMMFTSVGAEVGFSSWVFTQLSKVTLSTDAIAALAASLFSVGLTVARGLAGLLLRRISDEQLTALAVLVVGLSVLVMLLIPGVQVIALICAFMAGMGCGPLFPTVFAMFSRRYPDARGAASGMLIALGSFGAVVLPWLQGQIGGGHSGGMIQVLALSVIMFVLARRIAVTA